MKINSLSETPDRADGVHRRVLTLPAGTVKHEPVAANARPEPPTSPPAGRAGAGTAARLDSGTAAALHAAEDDGWPSHVSRR